MKKAKFILVAASLSLALTFTISCSSDDGDGISYGSFSYEGQTYKTIVIGEQTWMAENLNFATENGSVCYDNISDNCKKYGRLYDWETAMNVCPDGWHLPTNAEWDELLRFVDSDDGTSSPYKSEIAGKYLKAKSGWNDIYGRSGNGEDTYGFAALPGGSNSGSSFRSIGSGGHWWSASERNANNAYYRGIGNDSESVVWRDEAKNTLISVRCVKN